MILDFDDKSSEAVKVLRDIHIYLCSICKSTQDQSVGKRDTTNEDEEDSRKKITDNRREYLSFLWSCYEILLNTCIVGEDPTKCRFPSPKEFGHNELLKRLSDRVWSYVFDSRDCLSYVRKDGRRISVILPDPDSASFLNLRFFLK